MDRPQVEEDGEQGAVGDGEGRAAGKRQLGEAGVEHAVGGVEIAPRLGDADGVAATLGPQLVGHDLLHRRGEVVVADPIPQPGLERVGWSGRDQDGAGEAVEVLDDRRRLRQREVGVLVAQDGNAGERPQLGELLPALGPLDDVGLERQAQLVEGDEDLLAVRRERVLVEDEGHGGRRSQPYRK